LAWIDRDNKGIHACLGFRGAVNVRWTDSERARGRVMRERLTCHAATKARRRYKPDDMLMWCCPTEMHATAELQAEYGDAAFAGRAAGG
jgi:hypothetical protein